MLLYFGPGLLEPSFAVKDQNSLFASIIWFNQVPWKYGENDCDLMLQT